MYKPSKSTKTDIRVNKSYEGETIEQKVHRLVNNKEPLKEPGVVLQYTERREGVRPEYNPRTDRWELGLDAMDKVTADKLAKRAARHAEREQLKGDGNLKAVIDGEAKSIAGSNDTAQK